MLTVRYTITCDGSIWHGGELHRCTHFKAADTEADVRRTAADSGWQHALARDYCKPCAKAQRSEHTS